MEAQNYLGIYLSKDSATVVCLGSQGRGGNVQGCFSVSVGEKEERNISADMSELARLIAEGCAERGLEFSEVAVALDCAMFMQHSVHSEFRDTKQIAQTVRFDTEEALSTDISDVAVAFKITSSDETGSELTVFTAQRQMFSDILLSLQSNGIDPITVEPDVNCLSRFILKNVSLPEDSPPLFGALSRRRGYFVGFAKSRETPTVRTFLVDHRQNRSDLLTREVLVTVASAGADEPMNCLRVFDSTDSINCQQLGEKLGIEVIGVDLAESVAAGPDILADCADAVEFVVAYGAALTHLEKAKGVNFRDDFMPYQGKKLRLQKTLKFLSVSVSVLMLALGMYLTSQLLQTNKYRGRLRKKFELDYLAVIPARRKVPPKLKDAVTKLGSAERILRRKTGDIITGDEAVSAKLRLLLAAFNECAAATKLHIDSISISSRNISVSGSTAGRANRNTLKLFTAIKKNGLKISQQRLSSDAGRDKFNITVAPKGS
ncbi:MAG: type II secretion system protein GspL [Planctomycetota bacterium]